MSPSRSCMASSLLWKFLKYKTRSVYLTLLEALWKEWRCNTSGAKHQALGCIFKSKVTNVYIVENLSVIKTPANGCWNSYECTRIIHSGQPSAFPSALSSSTRPASSPPSRRLSNSSPNHFAAMLVHSLIASNATRCPYPFHTSCSRPSRSQPLPPAPRPVRESLLFRNSDVETGDIEPNTKSAEGRICASRLS
jgi:hypothetical protein